MAMGQSTVPKNVADAASELPAAPVHTPMIFSYNNSRK